MSDEIDLIKLWGEILAGGGTDAYVQRQLQQRGYLVTRRPTQTMSRGQLSRYKKELKAEAEERRKLRRQAWDAYRANHIVHLGENVYWNDAADLDRFDLDEPEARLADNGLPRLDKPDDLAKALEIPITELRWLAYHRDAATTCHYRRFTIPKASGGERAIWAPMPKLKKAQRWILREIVERLPVHGAAHGFLPGRSIATNAGKHTGARIVLKMDVRDFFPSVSLPRVRGVFRKAGYREQLATLLALLCTESPREIIHHQGKKYYIAMSGRCLPQGAPTSPGLTNALSMRMDRRLSGLAASKEWRYTRYADDLTFSLPEAQAGPPGLGALIGGVKRIVAEEGFSIAPEKTRISRRGGRQHITGLVVNGDQGPRPPREVRRTLRAALHNLERGRPLREGETLASLEGLAAYLNMTDPERGGAFLARIRELKAAAQSS